jgi:uncharacterized membrane protein
MDAQAPAARLLDRLIFLSDGAFAIAMTLLVVELVTPTLTSTERSALVNALVALGPKYLSFGVSFLVIASYWTSHQWIFSYIMRCGSRLMWLNLLLLLCIAFQPFPTSVLGTYGTTPAVTLYAGTLAFTGTVVLVIWLYASTGHRLVRADLDARLIRHHTYRAASVVLVFLASIAISQVNPTMAEFSWLAIAAFIVLLRWLYR